MSRDLSSGNAAAAAAKVVRPVLLARLDYLSAPVCVASTPFDVMFAFEPIGLLTDFYEELLTDAGEPLMADSERTRFYGVGGFGGISVIEEGADTQAYAINMRLSGVDQANLAIALNETYRGRDCRVWLGFVNDQHQLVDDPFVLFRGRIDTQIIDMFEKNITLSATSRLMDWNRERIRRLTDEDQQSEYPGDKGLQYVAQMIEKQIAWGQ